MWRRRGGIHRWSGNGVKWELYEKVQVNSRNIVWEDGTGTRQNHFERPFPLIENGKPIHLFAAMGEDPKAWQPENTRNTAITLKH